MRYLWLCLVSSFLLGLSFAETKPELIPQVHFLRDDYSILDSEKSLLEQNIRWLKQNPSAVLILAGHCDAWGGDAYNLQLGDLRAREVKTYLMEEGVDPERMIMVVSFGKRRPLDPRSTQSAWDLNRRVEFIVR